MRTRRGRLGGAVLAALIVGGTAPAVARAPARMPPPASAREVAQLVSMSPAITTLPTDLAPPLPEIHLDNPWRYYKVSWPDCPTLTSCVFGDKGSHRVMALFGDSHALMWLPAIEPIARRHGFRLLLAWTPDCPAASVSFFDRTTRSYATWCDEWRSVTIRAIATARPSLILLASETAGRWASPQAQFTDAQWEAGLERTISLLQATHRRIVVIGDIPTFNFPLPDCLAAYPADVQRCGVAIPNPTVQHRGHQHAELAAAAATGALYVNTEPWLCAPKWCSPVVGNMPTYINDWHVTSTYAHFLSGVFAIALRSVLS